MNMCIWFYEARCVVGPLAKPRFANFSEGSIRIQSKGSFRRLFVGNCHQSNDKASLQHTQQLGISGIEKTLTIKTIACGITKKGVSGDVAVHIGWQELTLLSS
jgi:hypothetical protein